jgi:hypothetical protein
MLVMVYSPVPNRILIRIPGSGYSGRWYDPQTGSYQPAVLKTQGRKLEVSTPGEKDMVLVLERE